MVELEAARGDDRLHNFASFLARTAGGKVVAVWMVEAIPAHSDEFGPSIELSRSRAGAHAAPPARER